MDKKEKEASFFEIEKKRKDDDRDGEYWVTLATRGCGCCADDSFDLHSKDHTILIFKEWIAKKEDELKKLKSELDALEKEKENVKD